MGKFTASIVRLRNVSCKHRVAMKGLSVARWPSASADERGHGDSQTDLSLNADLSLQIVLLLAELLNLPGFFFLICKTG